MSVCLCVCVVQHLWTPFYGNRTGTLAHMDDCDECVPMCVCVCRESVCVCENSVCVCSHPANIWEVDGWLQAQWKAIVDLRVKKRKRAYYYNGRVNVERSRSDLFKSLPSN